MGETPMTGRRRGLLAPPATSAEIASHVAFTGRSRVATTTRSVRTATSARRSSARHGAVPIGSGAGVRSIRGTCRFLTQFRMHAHDWLHTVALRMKLHSVGFAVTHLILCQKT